MSEIAIGRQAPSSPFRLLTVAVLIAVGIAAFIAMLILGAYAPDMRSGRNGGTHALSNGATGFRALYELAEATGRDPRIVRSEHQFDSQDLLIASPDRGSVNISAALAGHTNGPLLFILPKWDTVTDTSHPGWVRGLGLIDRSEPAGVLAPGINFEIRRYRSNGSPLRSPDLPRTIHFAAPHTIQAITGVTLTSDQNKDVLPLRPLVSDEHGGILLAQLGKQNLFVLADPDLFSNFGLRDPAQAASALATLDWINGPDNHGMAFDVSFNGLGHSSSPLKLLFEPPFLALTLGIAAALLLTGWHAVARFGPALPRQRAIAFGKAALVNNSAALMRKARREAHMGGRYAVMIRDRAARAFGAPARLQGEALDAYLDGLKRPERFTTLRQRAEDAPDRIEMLRAARALHAWQTDKDVQTDKMENKQ